MDQPAKSQNQTDNEMYYPPPEITSKAWIKRL